MTLAISTTLRTSFDDAVARTRNALAEQGFGVLTEIDMRATLQRKLGEEIEDYLILGACNPSLAFRALGADRHIGLLLPCNVVIRGDVEDAGAVRVEAMDPQIMVEVAGEPSLQPVADDAAARLRAAIDSLTATTGTSR